MAREMKDSGVAWIGEIPAVWNVIAFWQAILRMGTGLNPRDNFQLTKTDPLYYVTIRNFKDGHLFLDDGCDRISKDAWEVIQERSDLQKGDILFASISKDGQAYILESDPVNWNINESVFCIRVNPEYFTEKYFYYHLINAGYYEDLRMDATGSTFQSIKQNKLRKSRMVLPPLSEQKRISDCLDHKCLEIDSVIADTQRTIEEYKKLKQSVITQAVTKGIRGERPMKDSGIEWIGEIPTEWEARPIKNSFFIVSGATPKSDNADYWDGDISWVTPADYKFEDKYVYAGKRNLSQAGYASCGTTLVPAGSIIFSKRAPIGTVAIAGKEICTNQGCLSCVPKEGVCSMFFYYAMAAYTEQFNLYGTGTTFKEISFTSFSDFKMPLPPYEEQQEIASWLEEKCDEIDKLIENKQQLLTELESYKKSVIYEYVTGKKEVPACQ